ncbi:MAG: phosphoesterase [Candidatus Nitrosocaldaceae archaeon]|nr:MAG: phosphoesterase [Candidatus Nitrosocaldaceae archaeon]
MNKIDKHISIVDPYPCVYIDDTLIISDTHLGLEEQRERLGISIPISVTDTIIDYIIKPVKELSCKRVILLGDVKHEFGKPSSEEWFAVRKMIKSIREQRAEPEVVRGNHDNYIINILRNMDVKLHDPYLLFDTYFFMHGHIDLEDRFDDAKYIFLGHEHPAITIRDDVNAKHRFKAFLVGRINNRKIIVLPSASPLAYGNPVNEITKDELLSIFLRKYGVDEFTPYLIEVGEAVKKFPKIKYLRI